MSLYLCALLVAVGICLPRTSDADELTHPLKSVEMKSAPLPSAPVPLAPRRQAVAYSGQASAGSVHQEAHVEESHLLGLALTAKVMAGTVVHPHEDFRVVGFGGQVTFPLYKHTLELEIGGGLLESEHGDIVPLEVMLAYVMHVKPWFEPYVSLGPSISIIEHEVIPGAMATTGANFWTSGHFGLHGEAMLGQYYGHEIAHEVSGGFGVSYRY